MKKIILFETKLRFFLAELPLIFLLCTAIRFNDSVDRLIRFFAEKNVYPDGGATLAVVRLYPLIVFLALSMLFVFLWFFRFVVVSDSEIREYGLFSARDSALFTEGSVLIFTLLPHGCLRVELEGENESDGSFPLLGAELSPVINLFRHRVLGGKATVRSVLTFFGVPKDEGRSLLDGSRNSFSSDAIRVSCDTENDLCRVRIEFLELFDRTELNEKEDLA